ncbi:hypothetical protein AW736_11500 [Termitidicoccus mucosus]|uniref:Uncharacterized protein n=2 Tax=Termitidicoccus mucosus TaxID=1184151 RepID=A0A178IJJ3_9BACT|nr:hypothetical protein AW736_11500 [Opitutaceae bacterium TSB47]
MPLSWLPVFCAFRIPGGEFPQLLPVMRHRNLHRILTACACLFSLFALPGSRLRAETVPSFSAAADLGEGLRYLRINNIDTDGAALQAALSQPAPLVIDLRAAAAPRDGGVAGFAGRTAHDPAPLRLLLVNAGTPAGLLRAFALPAPGWLTLGPATPGLAVDIAVSASVEADRRAVAALAAGTPPEKLLNRQPEKNRYDEAALIRDYTNQPAEAPAPAGHTSNDGTESAPPGASAAQPDADAAESPPADAVLQRARDIHRALLALKKIP